MRSKTTSIDSNVKIRLGLDRKDFQLYYDTIEVYTLNEP